MFVIRFLVLGFLAFYSYAMGTQPGGLNAFGKLVSLSAIIFIPALYMLPTIEAWLRKRSNLSAIAALNLLLGWTLVGWVVALVWAFKRPSFNAYPQAFQPAVSNPAVTPESVAVSKPKKDCPFCGEEVLAIAIKCKHCGSDLAT